MQKNEATDLLVLGGLSPAIGTINLNILITTEAKSKSYLRQLFAVSSLEKAAVQNLLKESLLAVSEHLISAYHRGSLRVRSYGLHMNQRFKPPIADRDSVPELAPFRYSTGGS